MTRVYLDHNATTPMLPEALEAMTTAARQGGNASSIHHEGRGARALIETARVQVAELAGNRAYNVIFTGSGTEADNLALAPGVEIANRGGPATYLLISSLDHAAILSGHRFPKDAVEIIPALPDGEIDLSWLRTKLRDLHEAGERVLVSVMLANNETGIIQPLRTISKMVHDVQGLMHTDAVQAAGKIPLDMRDLGVDLMSLSAHKFGGPSGIGALVVCGDIVTIPPLVRGGGQEQRRRAGTENLPGIAGFGVAASLATERVAKWKDIAELRAKLEQGLLDISPDVTIFGKDKERLGNTTYLAQRNFPAETVVIAFDLAGIAVSSGSACSSGKVAPSHVLMAMGVDSELAASAIRVSLGRDTTVNEVDRFLEVWSDITLKLAARSDKVKTKTTDSDRAA
ncbi:MAG: cysteine desulfurase [Fimbriimonadaceae bacterium]|nr:cysteine desulfurase [Alphaproteobacteria bacterium]